MAKKSRSKIPMSLNLRDYWFLTITAGLIAGFSIQQVLYLLPDQLGIGNSFGTPDDFVLQQVVSAAIGIVVALFLLLIRKAKP